MSGLGEAGDRLTATPPDRPGWHREDCVLGQEGGDGIDVAPRPSIDVALDELAHPLVAEGAQRRLLALVGESRVDGLASTLQGAVHRRNRGLQQLRHLPGREAEHLAQNQDRPLRRRQMLERSDEGKLEGLALLVASVGRRVTSVELLVRIRLDPNRLDERLTGFEGRAARRAVVDRKDALWPPRDRVQAGIGGDPVEPGAKRTATLELLQPAPCPQEGVLQRVVCVV